MARLEPTLWQGNEREARSSILGGESSGFTVNSRLIFGPSAIKSRAGTASWRDGAGASRGRRYPATARGSAGGKTSLPPGAAGSPSEGRRS